MDSLREIAVVSNFKEEDARAEDSLLSDALSKHIPSVVVDLLDVATSERRSDTLYLFRNIWGRDGVFEKDFGKLYETLEKERTTYRNIYNGKGDQKGKKYLIELYQAGHQVVPTFDSTDNALKHKASSYVVKPIVGSSAVGQMEIRREELRSFVLDNKHLIQPKIDFTHESSLFFIDQSFQYALKTRTGRWDLELYHPTDEELEIAQEFIRWNPVKGIQRVDFLHTKEGQTLLLELEDWCPYLSLFDVAGSPPELFIKNLLASFS